jgi:hypothetical protein
MSALRDGVAARRVAVERASRRARWASVAVLAAAVARAIYDARAKGSGLWLGSGLQTRGGVGAIVGASLQIASLAAGVLFLQWVHRAVSNAGLLGAPLKWSPGHAVLAYVVPVVSIVLPYYVMKALYRASDPLPLGDAPVFRDRVEASYRDGARELLAPPRWISPAPILAWWILFNARLVSGVIAESVAGGPAGRWVAAFSELAAGVLCVLVVRSVDSRQRERCRRLDAAEDAAVAP